MLKKEINKPNIQNTNGVTFFCDRCNTVGKVFVECWTDGSDGPYKVDLVQHENHIAFAVGEIIITRKPKGDTIRYHFCGNCGQLLDTPIDFDFLKVLDRFNPITPKN
jgi:hypothetical protein